MENIVLFKCIQNIGWRPMSRGEVNTEIDLKKEALLRGTGGTGLRTRLTGKLLRTQNWTKRLHKPRSYWICFQESWPIEVTVYLIIWSTFLQTNNFYIPQSKIDGPRFLGKEDFFNSRPICEVPQYLKEFRTSAFEQVFFTEFITFHYLSLKWHSLILSPSQLLPSIIEL